MGGVVMSLTLTDMFCGAGGSSTGAIAVPGVELRVASKHWQLAIETHNTNHQNADHICADLSQIDPRYFPTTDLLWASPECTNHSRAKGKKKDTQQAELWGESLPDEAAERSRATMFDVLRFAEYHQYRAILVENVVEVCDWVLFPSWRAGLEALGYRVQVVSLNSMHAQAEGLPAPQSRDRIYFLCTRKGDPIPDLARLRPRAYCPTCDEVVRAVQVFKKPKATVGRYRSQYVYRCPNVKCRNAIVEPAWLPASTIIDWTLRGQRIGDRSKPLAEKTRARIAAGIARYWSPIHLEAAGNTYDAADPKHAQHGNPNSYYRAWTVDEPLRTLHTIESKALAVPVEGRDGKVAQPLDKALRTQTTRLETGLATPPFIAELRGGGSTARPVADPLATVTASGNHHGLVMSYYGNNDSAKPTDLPVDTVTTTDRHAILQPQSFVLERRHEYRTRELTEPLSTVTANETTKALIMRNNTGGAEMVTPATEPVRTITTAGHQSVLTADDIAKAAAHVDDVLFRMLEPAECKRAMAFPGEYVILGNRREQVRMAGNAVTPPAARDLIACVVAALTGDVA
jgi:DNA (cytosine-5)-methyltransferase 1